MHVIERETANFSHAEIGAYLLGLWGFPFSTVEAVAYHHTPQSASDAACDEVLVAVHVADALVHELSDPEYAGQLDAACLEQAGCSAMLPAWRQIAAEHVARVHGDVHDASLLSDDRPPRSSDLAAA